VKVSKKNDMMASTVYNDPVERSEVSVALDWLAKELSQFAMVNQHGWMPPFRHSLWGIYPRCSGECTVCPRGSEAIEVSRVSLVMNKPAPELWVLAHRGASREAPANTRPAFDLALQQGADALETDVHVTRDGEIVVCHDPVVDAVSDGTGAIAQCSLSELKRLDFGYRFTPDEGLSYPFRGKRVEILTLTELLNSYPQTVINVDLKPRSGVSVRKFLSILDACDALSRVVVASFHQSNLHRVRLAHPTLVTSASTREVARFLVAFYANIRPRQWPFRVLQVPLRTGRIPIVSARLVERARQQGLPVDVWTVDDEQSMRALYQLGVRGLVTNRPGLASRVRKEFLDRNIREDFRGNVSP
jgi:glycerophosphoryl diester phosphodiesterase